MAAPNPWTEGQWSKLVEHAAMARQFRAEAKAALHGAQMGRAQCLMAEAFLCERRLRQAALSSIHPKRHA
jgi:hypothetical protein